jgi:hypothetical protein
VVTAYAVGEMMRRHEPMRQELVSMHEELAALMDESEWARVMAPYRIDNRY